MSPIRFDKNMMQVFYTAAFAVSALIVPLTVASFATPRFAHDYNVLVERVTDGLTKYLNIANGSEVLAQSDAQTSAYARLVFEARMKRQLAQVAGAALPAPALRWAFESVTGNIAADEAGANSGTIAGGITQAVGYDGNDAYYFDGVNDYVYRAPLSFSLSGDLTLSFWVKSDGTTSLSSRVVDLATAGGAGLNLKMENGDLKLDSSGGVGVDYATFMSNNVWHHVAVTRSGNVYTLYFDGGDPARVKDATIFTTTGTSATYTRLFVGAQSSRSKFFKGSVDEVKLFNSALTVDQIALLAAKPVTPPLPPSVSITLPLAGSTVGLKFSASGTCKNYTGTVTVYYYTSAKIEHPVPCVNESWNVDIPLVTNAGSGSFDLYARLSSGEEVKQNLKFNTQPSLTVLSPNGGEQWAIGETRTITWNSTNLPATALVGIELENTLAFGEGDTPSHYSLIANVANTGSYQWKIPVKLGEFMPLGQGTVYKVLVQSSGVGDSSNQLFKIGLNPPLSPAQINVPILISRVDEILNPVSGTQVLVNTQTINDNPARFTATVSEDEGYRLTFNVSDRPLHQELIGYCYYRTGSPECSVTTFSGPITAGYCRDGFCTTTAALYRPGSPDGYTFKFAVKYVSTTPQPSITVLSPNGGETIEIGKQYIVAWSVSSFRENRTNFGLELLDVSNNPVNNFAVINGVPSQGTRQILSGQGTSNSFQIVFPSTILNGSYRFRVSLCPGDGAATVCLGTNVNSLVSDVSNAPFTITNSQPKPTLHLPFDGVVNGTTPDIANSANVVAAVGTPAQAIGQIGKAILFDGVNDIVSDKTLTPSITGDFTLGMWVKHRSSMPSSARLFDLALPGASGVNLKFNSPTSLVVDADGGVGSDVSVAVSPDVFYHLAVTRSGSVYSVYIDGVQVAKRAGVSAPAYSRLFVGGRVNGGNLFTGAIDDVQLYNSALTAEQIKNVMALTTTTPLPPPPPSPPPCLSPNVWNGTACIPPVPSAPTPPPPTASTQTSASFASVSNFTSGGAIVMTGKANVREKAGLAEIILEEVGTGSTGEVKGGPVVADGYIWWRVAFDSGVYGWVADVNFTKR